MASDTLPALRTALALRTYVLPRVPRADLVSVALSLPGALGRTCLRFLGISASPAALAHPLLLDALVLACAQDRPRTIRLLTAAPFHVALDSPRILSAAPAPSGPCERFAPSGAANFARVLCAVAALGHPAAARALAEPPLRVTRADLAPLAAVRHAARAVLRCVCENDMVESLRVLARALGPRGAAQVARAGLEAASAAGSAAALRELARPPFGLGRGWPLCALVAGVGSAEVVDVLCGPPFCMNEAEAAAGGYAALLRACKRGWAGVIERLAGAPFALGPQDVTRADASGAGPLEYAAWSVDVALALERPPFCLGGPLGQRRVLDPGWSDGLVQSVFVNRAADPVGQLARLMRPPFRVLETEPQRVFCLQAACYYGNIGAVERLCAPPFSLGREHARMPYARSDALRAACLGGHVSALDRLAQPPFSLCDEEPEALLSALVAACTCATAPVVRRLSQEPYNAQCTMPPSGEPLRAAALAGKAEVVAVLGADPYRMGHAEASAMDNALLCDLCKLRGSGAMIALLGRPPFSLGHEDAVARDGLPLEIACEAGNVEAVCALGSAPYLLGAADVRANNYAAVCKALSSGASELVAQLMQPPYSVTQAEIDAAARTGCSDWGCGVHRRSESEEEFDTVD
eukprot:m51a1_g2892 hypothetical protein (637) ;mRNA; r:430180-432090